MCRTIARRAIAQDRHHHRLLTRSTAAAPWPKSAASGYAVAMTDPPAKDSGRVRTSAIVRGSLWAVISMVSFALVPVAVRQLSGAMPASEMVFFRCLIGFAIMLSWYGIRRTGSLRAARIGPHLARSVLQFVGMVLFFHAIGQMALDKAVAIHFTLPLFVVIFAALFLGEKVGWNRWLATLVGFAGVLVILRPGMVEVGLPAIGVIVSAALYGAGMIYMKIILRADSPTLFNLYSNLLLGAMALPVALFDWHTPGMDDLPWLLLLGICGATAPYCFAVAMRLLDASIVAPFDYLRLPFTAVMAFLFFGEVPEIWTWIGAAILIASTWRLMRTEHAREPKSTAAMR